MPIPRAVGLALTAVCIAASLSWYFADNPVTEPTTDTQEYVDASTCQACHAERYRTYQHVGMSRSFAQVGPTHVSACADRHEYRHAASGRRYEVVRRDGRLYQRRYELDANGRITNDYELQATHVIGSGNHARTYLHRLTSGEFVELPLTWYAETGAWAMSPGYDNANPPDFTRLADESCLFCHNGYPRADGALPNGIDCQRCHGPGRRHIQAASARDRSVAEVRSAIINPARLSPELQMDICMQCHLETTSAELPQMLRRLDREPNSYRPGQSLGSYMVHFDHASGSALDDKFEIVNQAYRLRKSACFLNSGGKLTCSSCHDPHSVPRGDAAVSHYRTQCMNCHPAVDTANHPVLARADCRGCHMPRRRAEDAVHTVMTDHFVQRKPPSGLLAPRKERAEPYTGDVVIYYPPNLSASERDLYLGAALAARSTHRQRGSALLERAVGRRAPPRAHAVLGEAYLGEGRHDDAIREFTNALGKRPDLAKARYNLAQALEAAGSPERAKNEYAAALRTKSPFPEAEFGLANLLARSGDVRTAEDHYRKAVTARPVYAEAWSNLGALYADAGQLREAEDTLTMALRLSPEYAEAHNNLARVLAGTQRIGEAIEHARKAVALKPDFAEARYNFAQLLQATSSLDAAIREYRQVLTLRPRMAVAHLSLGAALADTGQVDDAIAEFREALRLAPDNTEAQRMLAMALALRKEEPR